MDLCKEFRIFFMAFLLVDRSWAWRGEGVWPRIVDQIDGRRVWPEFFSVVRRAEERAEIGLKPENLCFWFWVKAIEGSAGPVGGFWSGLVWEGVGWWRWN